MTAAKKIVKSVGCWEKLSIIHGEPTQCRLAKSAILYKSNTETIIQLSGDDSMDAVKNTLHGMCFSTTALVLSRPTNDQCKAVLDAIDNNRCSPDIVVVITPGEYIDARWTLLTAATKQKRVFTYDFIEAHDRFALLAYLKSWCEINDVVMSSQVLDYICKSGPTICTKIKGGNGQKKDAIIYNLEALANELDKVICLSDNQNLSYDALTEYCNFERVDDVWTFVRIAVGGTPEEILSKLESSTTGQSLESALWMLLSQVDFLLQVSKAGSTDPYVVTQRLSLSGTLGVYLTEDFGEPPIIEAPVINNWRVRKALEDRSMWINVNLTQSYKAIISALQDLRGKLDERIVAVTLSLALAGAVAYDTPYVGSFE